MTPLYPDDPDPSLRLMSAAESFDEVTRNEDFGVETGVRPSGGG